MAETKAQIGYMTLLKMGDGATPEVFATIAEVKAVDGFGFTTELLEATHMESPARGKEYIAGLQDGETVTFRCNFTIDNISLKDTVSAGVTKHFQIQFPEPDLPTYAFTGSPVSWHILNIEPNGILEVECGFKISGGITEVTTP